MAQLFSIDVDLFRHGLRRCAAPCLAIGVYAVFALLVFYPMSLAPHRLFPAHRTAAEHAALMHYAHLFFRAGPAGALCHVNLWGYPTGGIVQPLAVPALAVGAVLGRVCALRLTFNLIFLLNLVGSGFAFYHLARRLYFGTVTALWVGAAAAFHPIVQSFILRGQIENSMLWTVGLALLAQVALLDSRRQSGRAFAAACLLPATLLLFATPYNAVFYVLLAPVIMALAALRQRARYRAPAALGRSMLAYVVAVVLILPAIQFYRLGPRVSGLATLNPGSLEAGLSLRPPLTSLLSFVTPSGVLTGEQPYLGFAMIAAALGTVGVGMARRRVDPWVPLGGMLAFGLLAAGREVAIASTRIPLPAAWIDAVVPDFRHMIMLFRALPLASLCAALAVAAALESAQRDAPRARWTPLVLMLLLALDGVLASPLSKRTDLPHCRRADADLPAAVADVPTQRQADLPVLDFPPPVGPLGRLLWSHYTYLQTEHRQRLVWMDALPDPPTAVQQSALDLFNDAEAYLGDAARANQLLASWRAAGIGLVALHPEFIAGPEAAAVREFLDAHLERIADSPRLQVWRVGEG